ncbi:uncharacterized protein LOC141903915 [Tubulanus polymorphus]|uniref:uncharacterized protein LOC141903915 n=1 Tax=Tubulanus polymorphus TaxID=672921 RepID=UPI003DA447EB
MWCDSYCGPDGKTTMPSQNCGMQFCCGTNLYKYCCSNAMYIISGKWNYGGESNVCLADHWWIIVLPIAICAVVFTIISIVAFLLVRRYKRQRLAQIQAMSHNRSSYTRITNAAVPSAPGLLPPAYGTGDTTYQNQIYPPKQSV